MNNYPSITLFYVNLFMISISLLCSTEYESELLQIINRCCNRDIQISYLVM